MTCPATGACLICRIAGLIECPFRDGERETAVLPLVEAEKPKVTWKKFGPNNKVVWDGRMGFWSGAARWPK